MFTSVEGGPILPPQKYRMVRVREEDFERLQDAQRLLQAKGMESIDWGQLIAQNFVRPPGTEEDDDARRAALSAGFVIGLSAAALAVLVAQRLRARESDE
jgi:hypothetical protein